MELPVLKCGHCEPLKIGVHGMALGLAAVMGLYNAAAWLSRRQRHLAVNAVLYAALTAWEQQHVAHHWAELRRMKPTPETEPVEPTVDASRPADLAA
jgi:hypothetical protein